jgi:hypothetical protein
MLLYIFTMTLHSKPSTNTTPPSSTFHVKVRPEEWMPFLTMPSITNKEIHSTHGVHLRCCDFQMSWVHAFLIPAKVIALKMLGNCPKKEFVRKTVSIFLEAMGYRVTPVSVTVRSSSPHPAPGTTFNRNLLSKTRRQRVKINTFHIHPHGSRKTAMGAIFLS